MLDVVVIAAGLATIGLLLYEANVQTLARRLVHETGVWLEEQRNIARAIRDPIETEFEEVARPSEIDDQEGI